MIKKRASFRSRYKEATQNQSEIDNYFDRYQRMPDMPHTEFELFQDVCSPYKKAFFWPGNEYPVSFLARPFQQ